MSELETKAQFTGDTGWIIVGILCCIPFGIYYYFDNKEEMWVCPSCQETIKKGASTCRYCDENMDEYT